MDTEALNNEVTTMLKKYTNQTFKISFNFGTLEKPQMQSQVKQNGTEFFY